MAEVEELLALHAANRRRPDAEAERRLLRMRVDLFARREPSGDTFHVEAGAPDGVLVGLPSISPPALDANRLRESIITYGVAHVKGLLSPDRVAEMRKVVDAALDAQERHYAGVPVQETSPWFEPTADLLENELSRVFVRADGGVLAADSPRGLFHLLDLFYSLGVDRLVGDYFGERPALSSEKTTLRRALPGDTSGDWHQDGRFLGSQIRSLNFWVALSDCPADQPGGLPTTPGLELVASRLHRIVQTGTAGAKYEWSVADDLVQREFAGKMVRPQFAAGDALFFDHFSLHRTWRCPGVIRPRHALESWFFAPSMYPSSHTGAGLFV